MLNDPTSEFLDGLCAFLGPQGWRAAQDAPDKFEEPRGKWPGHGALVVRPETVEQVAEVVRRANAAHVGLIPHSGGTGLVGGQVMRAGGPRPVLLSMERMNRIRDIAPDDGVLVAEAGAILADVQTAADAAGRLFPLSLASEGSCRIGGNLSTNAGGVQVLRYGNARDLCLGVEAVLPDGSVMHGLKRLRKDNTGYDLRHLLIGAEGTLGVITAAALKLLPKPKEVSTAFLSVPSPAIAVDLLHRLRDQLGDVVTAFELIDGVGLGFLEEADMALPLPFPTPPKWSVLVEVAGHLGVGELLEHALADAMEAGLATDGALAQTEGQRKTFWAIRETIPLANKVVGAIASHDISVPVGDIPAFINRAHAAFADYDPTLRINCFGHVGDGNLHYNIYTPKGRAKADFANQAAMVTRIVHDLTAEAGGSFSAEHGVGRAKVEELERYGDPAKLAAMRAIKSALDPHGIMNPGAVLRGHA
ncbi:MAG: FAD-binding oxidoreductase [Pikeienuella sp.]